MKLGIVGTGLIVNTLFEFIDEIDTIEINAICSTVNSKDKMHFLAKEHHIKNCYTKYEDFLNDDSFDTVYIAIPNYLHYSYSYKALTYGKNVICEKPFTTNYRQALSLADLAIKNKLILLEAISNQYNDNLFKIKQLLPTLGNLKIVSFNFCQYSSRYDNFKKGIIQPVFDINKSGGALMDLNVYNIHLAIELFGMPEKVYYYPNIEKNIDTSGILIMDYNNFKVSSIAAKDCGIPSINTIQGDKGYIYSNSPSNTLDNFYYQLNKQDKIHYSLDVNEHRMKKEFIAFADMIDNNKYDEVLKHLDHTLYVMDILTQARLSADLKFTQDE